MSQPGVARQRWIEPIENFARDYGRHTPRWAVICTYECNLSVLGRRVLPVLSCRGRGFRTLVLADAGALEVQLRSSGKFAARDSVNVHPIRMFGGGVFHPKLVFLRAGPYARVCFGSANVSDGGFGSSLELWTESDDPEIIGGFVQFFCDLRRHSKIHLDPVCKRQLERAVVGLPKKESDKVWNSLDQSFKARLKGSRIGQKSAITIVSPMFATAGGIKKARSVFSSPKVTLFTDEPVAVPGAITRQYRPPSSVDFEAGEQPDFPSNLHAKLYAIERSTGDADAWIGSANFTAQALTKSLVQGGNVECMVHTVIPKDELHVLKKELNLLFMELKQTKPAPVSRPRLPAPRATVLSCELQSTRSGFQLVVFAVLGTLAVILERGGKVVKIKIRDGIGKLQAKDKLEALLGEPSVDFPQVLVIHQVIGKARVPIVVNVPYISDSSEEGSGPKQTLLDDLLNELRGITPKWQASNRKSLPEEADSEADDTEPDMDEEDMDLERRLDAVTHQGALDQLAVKTAIVRRMIWGRTEPGLLREELLKLARSSCRAACPPALWPILEEWLSK